eukprot:619320_1
MLMNPFLFLSRNNHRHSPPLCFPSFIGCVFFIIFNSCDFSQTMLMCHQSVHPHVHLLYDHSVCVAIIFLSLLFGVSPDATNDIHWATMPSNIGLMFQKIYASVSLMF